MNIVNQLHTIVKQILHNPVCWSCGLQHYGSKAICTACYEGIKYIKRPCVQCGLSHQGEQDLCSRCALHPEIWHDMVAPLSYQKPLSQLVQQLKYHQKLEVLHAIMELALPRFQAVQALPELLVAVPLHQNRYLERGFNQSYEMARVLSKALAIPCSDSWAERVLDTKRQSELSLKQRKINIKNAFVVGDEIKKYRHIALVDDVITSGSTVHELVKVCLRQGVKRVDVWAIARAEL